MAKAEKTLDLDLAKNYVFTLLDQALKEMNKPFTSLQSFQAEMHVDEYLDRCINKGYEKLTAEALAKFVVAGIIKTTTMEEMKKKQQESA